MGAPDQPRDSHGRWTAGASAGDHQASQSKPVGPGQQPVAPLGKLTFTRPESEHTIGMIGRAAVGAALGEQKPVTALQNKMAHDAGAQARLDAYAAAHGGRQAPNATGLAASWKSGRSPVTTHAGQKSVGTHPSSGGGGGGSGGGGRFGTGGMQQKKRGLMTRQEQNAVGDQTVRNKGTDIRRYGLEGSGPENLKANRIRRGV